MNEVNGQKVHFHRHEDDDWFDEISIKCIERYKTSGLSGDEWRFSYGAEFKRKGIVLHSHGWHGLDDAIMGLGGARHKASDSPMGKTWEDTTKTDIDEWCFQPGCTNKWTTLYRMKKRFVQGYEIPEDRRMQDSLGIDVIGFCEDHLTRGDCGLNDSDMNYEVFFTRADDRVEVVRHQICDPGCWRNVPHEGDCDSAVRVKVKTIRVRKAD